MSDAEDVLDLSLVSPALPFPVVARLIFKLKNICFRTKNLSTIHSKSGTSKDDRSSAENAPPFNCPKEDDISNNNESVAAAPIRVAPKRRSRKKSAKSNRARPKYVSPLFDNRGFPDPQDEWESMLPEVKNGRLLRKRVHDPPKLQEIDPDFGEEYDEAKHGDILRAKLNI